MSAFEVVSGIGDACAVFATVGACFVGILPRIAIAFFERFIV